MSTYVIDTNVAVVANGRNTYADTRCQLNCVKRLRQVIGDGLVAIDDDGAILAEYARNLGWSGAPGVGDAFFKHVCDHQYRCDKVKRVHVTPARDVQGRGFEELPRNSFDRADRKFLAVAIVGAAKVLNATDSDWREHEDLMVDVGVEVDELCSHMLKDGATSAIRAQH